MRDASGNFVKQITHQNLPAELQAGGVDWDSELQIMENGTWIPIEDIVPPGGDSEERAKSELRTCSADELLLKACREGNYELIHWAAIFGADLNQGDGEPLFLAVVGSHDRCVRLLVNKGASPANMRIITTATEVGNDKISLPSHRFDGFGTVRKKVGLRALTCHKAGHEKTNNPQANAQ